MEVEPIPDNSEQSADAPGLAKCTSPKPKGLAHQLYAGIKTDMQGKGVSMDFRRAYLEIRITSDSTGLYNDAIVQTAQDNLGKIVENMDATIIPERTDWVPGAEVRAVFHTAHDQRNYVIAVINEHPNRGLKYRIGISYTCMNSPRAKTLQGRLK